MNFFAESFCFFWGFHVEIIFDESSFMGNLKMKNKNKVCFFDFEWIFCVCSVKGVISERKKYVCKERMKMVDEIQNWFILENLMKHTKLSFQYESNGNFIADEWKE